jgi:hypothetical protein
VSIRPSKLDARGKNACDECWGYGTNGSAHSKREGIDRCQDMRRWRNVV